MNIPTATYRLQFNQSFGFLSAIEIVSYLKELGISHIYASPIFKARQESVHGYDAVDPGTLNPELGTPGNFKTLSCHLKDAHMGWLQDIVPNHLAYDFNNPALYDLLEKGENSVYRDFFDIDWQSPCPLLANKLAAPFLGDHYEKCLLKGHITLKFDNHGFSVNYFEFRLPLAIRSYMELLSKTDEVLRQKVSPDAPSYSRFTEITAPFMSVNENKTAPVFDDLMKSAKTQLWQLYRQEPDIAAALDHVMLKYNGEEDKPSSFVLLNRLLRQQVFRLRFWKTASNEINYRRFFDINNLISLRQEDESVFRYSHKLVLQLIKDNKINGLRIDHIDGLADPAAYLERLTKTVGNAYILVEKILDDNESLPDAWPVHGTTGYEFLNRVDGLFVDRHNKKAMESIIIQQTDITESFENITVRAKKDILLSHFVGELDELVRQMLQLAPYLTSATDITRPRLKAALIELLIRFPVYRTYTALGNPTSGEISFIQSANSLAVLHRPDLFDEFEFLQSILLNTCDILSEDKKRFQDLRKQAVTLLEQLTAPLTAKGFEDTALYRYPLLLSLNEVGGNPDQFGITRQSFHAFMSERARKFPYALNASSTHDCKRGEDVRARLNVLSEIPEQWGKKVSDWRMLNREKKICIENELVPGDTEESFIYQTLSGSWPLNEDTHPPPYVERMEAYMVKSLREAKINSSWHMPNETYETAVKSFVRDILKPGPENRFLTQFLPFYRKVAHYGVFNTLSQTLVKLTAPGIPDFYQGAELMNLNLVDPDNRRPVDYQQRKALLQKLKTAIAANGLTPFPTSTELIEKADYLKLFIIIKGLQARTSYVNVFRDGAYLPLETTGQFNRHVVAFARQFENHWSITVIPRFLTGLVTPEQSPLGQSLWDDTAVLLPSGVPGSWQSVLDSRCLKAKNQLIVGKLFERFPAALLTGD